MRSRLTARLHGLLERVFPERRLFLRSEEGTRFIRLTPETQLVGWTGSLLVVGWTIIATAILLMDSIGAGNFRAQAEREQLVYEQRLNALSAERDSRAAEAVAAHERFNAALMQISIMQSQLLEVEEKRRELERGLETVQATLRDAMRVREEALAQLAVIEAEGIEGGSAIASAESNSTVDLLSGALAQTAAERDQIASDAEFAITQAEELELELRLQQELRVQVFTRFTVPAVLGHRHDNSEIGNQFHHLVTHVQGALAGGVDELGTGDHAFGLQARVDGDPLVIDVDDHAGYD